MTADWVYPIAAFRRGADQPPVGAGVLVGGDVVLTCAHVVEDALKGTDVQIGLGSETSIDFPFANVTDLQAKVVGWYPVVPERNLRRDSSPTDLAVLRLANADGAVSIDACLIAETDATANTAFTCQGFPRGYPNGALAEGVLRGADAVGWVDAVANDGFGHFIEPGFSGAPVFARQQERVCADTVLGLCVTADSGGRRVARLIPPEHLALALRAVVSPYRWLEHFDQRDAAYFFGRNDLIEELSRHLTRQRFLLLAGPSGSGKSSLLRAGLFNVARRSGNQALVVRPLDDAWRELGRQLGLPPDPLPSDELLRRTLGARLRTTGRLLLGIDQAEELVQAPRRESPAEFLQFLADLRDEYDELQIALATRADALPSLLAAQPRSRLVERNLRYIDQLGRDELRAAIERPAARLRVMFEPGLAGIIVNDALQEPRIPLPIFQLCLSKLWESQTDAVITADAYRVLGGLTGVLAQHANALLEQIRPDSQTLLKLVEVGTQGQDRRRRVPLSDFGHPGAEVVKSLAAGRLVLISHDEASGKDVAELAHDSLLTEWTTLRNWIDENRAFRVWHDRLLARARDAPDDLLGEVALTEALARLNQDSERIDPVLRAFILRSRDAHRDRQLLEEARLRQERDVALRMSSLLLADRARQAVQDGDAMTGMLLALAALPDCGPGRDRPWVQEASVALQEAIARNRERHCLAHNGRVLHAAFSPDGARIVTASSDNTARVWDAATGNQLVICKGHNKSVRHTAFSPDGVRIVTASSDNTARVWDAATGNQLAICKGHDDSVRHAAFSPDGARIVTASSDNTAQVWDAATGNQLAICKGHDKSVRHAAFSPDGARIVTASSDNTARVWDAATGNQLAICKGHDKSVLHAAFSPDGARIVTASDDNTAQVWDAATGNQLAICKGHDKSVWQAAFSPDGAHIVTASSDNTAQVWDAATGNQLAICRGHDNSVLQAAFSPDGARIVTASYDNTARVWDAATGNQLAICKGHDKSVWHAAFSPDGARIVTASDDNTARVWDAATGNQLAICKGHDDSVRHAAFSPDGARIVTASSDNTARVWDAATGNQLAICKGHDKSVWHAAFSPDGARIVTASSDNTARVWDAATGNQLAICKGHDKSVLHAAFSPDGARIVTASSDNTAQVWDAATGNQLAICKGHENSVLHAAFSPDGTRIVTASSDNTARVWDAATSNQLAICKGHYKSVLHAAFSPDGARIVTASDDNTARVWDAATGNQLAICKGHDDSMFCKVWQAAFSPDGARIVTANSDNTAQVWDAGTGNQLAICNGHDGSVLHAAFSPDGARIVTASSDNTARVWVAGTGNQLAICKGHENSVLHAAFSPDGTRIVTASSDNTARVYLAFCNQEKLVAFAKSRVTRGLTQAQRIANYLDPPSSESARDNTIPPSPFGLLRNS